MISSPPGLPSKLVPYASCSKCRGRLKQLLSKMEGNDKLEQLLTDIISNTDKAHMMAVEMGIEVEQAPNEPVAEEEADGLLGYDRERRTKLWR